MVVLKKKKLQKWLCLLLWMGIIFLFSHQPHSAEATQSIVEKFLPNLKDDTIINILNFLIRKTAHFTEYFILAFLTYSLLKEYKNKRVNMTIKTLIFCFLYACSDELHQTFVEGRSGVLKDCWIDLIGSVFFIIIQTIHVKIQSHQKLLHKKSDL